MLESAANRPPSLISRPFLRGLAVVLLPLVLALLQTTVFIHNRPADGGPWFLFGKDTVGHDVPVQMWIWKHVINSESLPLWMPPLKGGLPTIGAFLWTPLAPTLWLHAVLPFHIAQVLQFTLAFWWAGLGGWWLARVLDCDRRAALIALVGCTLSGHVVTLVHAGHLQKILALAWLPWFAGGVVCALSQIKPAAVRLRGAAIASVALGMAFLCGHPQIAYAMLLLLALRVLFAGGLGILHKTSHRPALSQDGPIAVKRTDASPDSSANSPAPVLGETPKPPSPPCVPRPSSLVPHSSPLTPHPSPLIPYLLSLILSSLAIVCLGIALGAAQLFPGAEMGALSNRASGVSFAEAMDTSYPPLETAEFFLPRFLGDSSEAGYNHYVGKWGERLVSDYAGVPVILLALSAIAIAIRRAALLRRSPTRFRAEVLFWMFVALFFLVLGFGRYTPLYKFFYHVLPGLDRFRSPGTFMCGTALALPVLAALGYDVMIRLHVPAWRFRLVVGSACCLASIFFLWHHPSSPAGSDSSAAALDLAVRSALRATFVLLPWIIVSPLAWSGIPKARIAAYFLMPVILACDLLTANSHFLIAADWRGFEQYAAPNALDDALDAKPEPRRVYEPGREMSLRPILVGRDALLAYHPISYALYEDHLRATPFDSSKWRDDWGVEYLWQPSPEASPGTQLVERLTAAPGGLLLRDPDVRPPVRALSGRDFTWEWETRTPNRVAMAVDFPQADTLELAETLAPGWRTRLDTDPWQSARVVTLSRRVEVPPGEHRIEWEYQPRSWLVGLYATALAVALAAAAFTATRRGKAAS